MKKRSFKKAIFYLSFISLLPLYGCGKEEKVYNTIEYKRWNDYSVETDTEIKENSSEIITNEETNNYIDTEEETTKNINTEDEITINNTTEIINETEFDNFDSEVNNLNYFINEKEYEKAKEYGKKTFIRMVDFVFYDTKINGQTFDELNEETKEDILNNLKITDSLINNLEPGYKEKIGEKYNIVKDFSIDKLNDGKDLIKKKIGEEKYDEITNKKDEITTKAKEEVNKAKNKTKIKVKEWYENFRDN